MNDALLQQIRQCPSLPTLPAIAMQVLELAQRPEADLAEIARLISRDAALSGKILRTVNSSFYGRGQHVGTISQALVLLGLQSVKTLVLGFSLVSSLGKNQSKGFKHLAYWKRSIVAATAAKSIAMKINLVQQEEIFLSALLMDVGMLVLDLVLGEEYGKLNAHAATHTELLHAEPERIGITHAEVSAVPRRRMEIAAAAGGADRCSSRCTRGHRSSALKKMAEILSLAGQCADVFIEEDAAPAIAQVRKAAAQTHGFSEADCDTLLAEIGKRTREIAPLFEISISDSTDYESILRKANETLVEITLQTQQQSTTLQQQNKILKQIAAVDPLTGLANRGRFDQELETKFAAARAAVPTPGNPEAATLSLLMLDLDKFKSINDQYGHPAGDAVLRAVGRLLKAAVRSQDLAARFGGEEMVLLLPGSPRSGAAALAETIRRRDRRSCGAGRYDTDHCHREHWRGHV